MCDNGSLESHNHDESVLIKESENVNGDVLEELLDSYLAEKINPLTDSRFVSDSVTGGMLNGEGSEGCKDEYEQGLCEENVESCGMESLLLERTKEIAGLRRELELISKLLTDNEALDRKISGTLVSASSVWDRDDKHTGSLALTPEKVEYLRNLPHEELIKHFRNEMNEMKREHDYTIHEMSEEYFSIKRRYVNLEQHGLCATLKKDKEFDVVPKKIMEIISKLDKVLVEEQELVFGGKNDAYFKSQCDSLLEENRQLRESLREAESKIDLGDSCVESYLAEECCAIIYKEALKDADKKLEDLNMNVSEKDRALRSGLVVKEKLKEEIHCLKCLVKEKENLVQIAENELALVKGKLEIVVQENSNLQNQLDQQAVVIQDKNKKLRVASTHALEKAESYEMEISNLRKKFELANENMKMTENEKAKSELKLLSTEAEQKRLKNQFVSTVLSLVNWSQCFDNLECSIADKMRKTSSRLESLQSQLNDLLDEVDELKARESMYKQLMEKKTCDLQKAETEVDLLGDEIESLLNLLQKIFIALDHYSPILKHYPGIIEILKLVRRELRGERILKRDY